MSPKPQQPKDNTPTDQEAIRKAFQDAIANAQSRINAATGEIAKLRGDLKTQTAELKVKTLARIDEVTKDLDATRKEKQEKIEARIKALHTEVDSLDAELKHAGADRKVKVEAAAKAVREEYASARKALTASLEAELAEVKTRIDAAAAAADGKKEAAKPALQAKVADLQARYDAAQKKLQTLKGASATAYNELQRGARAAIAEVKKAVQHARTDISAAL